MKKDVLGEVKFELGLKGEWNFSLHRKAVEKKFWAEART